MKTLILAVGKLRGPEAELCAEYQKRLTGDLIVKEITTQKSENEALRKAVPPKSFVVLLDERGKDLSSREFAAKLKLWRGQNPAHLVFMIGGADGVSDDIREIAQATLAFGRATWPHRLARVMLIEQLYRAQQINAGHPYHRD